MAGQRDGEGNIIDDQAGGPAWKSQAGGKRDDEGNVPTDRRTADIAGATSALPRDPAATVPRGGSADIAWPGATVPTPGATVPTPGPRDTPKRTVVWPGTSPREREGAALTDRRPGAAADPAAALPVGWLVIVDGPGKGRVATIGMGHNSIGRDRTERLPLDYGDPMISRTNHGKISYDPRTRKFFVSPGGGTNFMYVNDEPLLAPREIEPFAHLQLGNTVLRFVPLCGDDFSWDDESERG